MTNYKQITLEERITIELELGANHSLAHIAKILGRSRSSIAREIQANRIPVFKGAPGKGANNCKHRITCSLREVCSECYRPKQKNCSTCGKCMKECPLFEEEHCPKIIRSPFCCNGCNKHNNCTLKRFRYVANQAQDKYIARLSESKKGVALTIEELEYIDQLVTPLILKGQSIHHIYIHHADDMPCSERTLYNIIDDGLIRARNIDLPRKVRRVFPKKKREHKVDQACRKNRTFQDYLDYLEQHPELIATQMDSVLGSRDSLKVLLTLYWPQASFMLILLRDRNHAASVTTCFDTLERKLGTDMFKQLFPLVLTDNGSEFSNPSALERDGRTKIFYCEPLQSNQKAEIERAQQFIRMALPKGTSFENLTQEKVDLLTSHINSYARPSLADKTPYDVFRLLFGSEVLRLLKLKKIPPDKVNLKHPFRNKNTKEP